ncbi:unnamed protein product [Sphagnum balticum]
MQMHDADVYVKAADEADLDASQDVVFGAGGGGFALGADSSEDLPWRICPGAGFFVGGGCDKCWGKMEKEGQKESQRKEGHMSRKEIPEEWTDIRT